MIQRASRQSWLSIVIMLMQVCIAACSFLLVAGSVKQLTDGGKAPLGDASAADTSCGRDGWCEPFYGMQFVYQDDLDKVKDLGVEVIMTDVPHDGTPADWRALLDAAQAAGIRLIPWLWPQGWTWTGSAWQIDAQAKLFLQTVTGHPALFAVYALHEPYWNGCDRCGYSTTTQQALYRAIKAIADVPLYSEVGSISGWTARGSATAFADGVCDYCATWYYPFKDGGIYERDKVITQLTADLAIARARAPQSKVVWMMPVYKYSPDHIRMPSADEMRDLASIVYSAGVAGAWWYPWKFNDLYSDYLFKHPELYPVVRSIYWDDVREAKGACCSNSLAAAFNYEPGSITVGDTVWFTSTSASCCGPMTYAWDWGDGTARVFVANTGHQYTTLGNFTVTLSVTDTLGYTDTHTVSNAVAVNPDATVTPTCTATARPSPTATRTPTATTTATATPTATLSASPTATLVRTVTPTSDPSVRRYLPMVIGR